MSELKDLKGMLHRPGPSRSVWEEALKRSGIDPAQIAEYNVPDEGTSTVTVEEMNKAVSDMASRAGRTPSDGPS